MLFFVSLTAFCMAENPSLNYITQYKEIAILEMQRTGIPASIKMAQALLESGAGRSTLARNANNHFGIKCGGSWEGETYYREDDDYYKGKLVKSCFRKFDSVYQSFEAHSNFLINQNRYSFLFEIPVSDYESWAKGLRKAGYATDKSYSIKLIEIIEKYELYLLDQNMTPFEGDSSLANAESEDFDTEKNAHDSENTSKTYKSERNRSRRKVSVNKNAKYHIVRENQSLSDIAILYEIDETSLRLRNRLPKDAEPLSGEKIHLKKKISLTSRPKFERVPNGDLASVKAEFIF